MIEDPRMNIALMRGPAAAAEFFERIGRIGETLDREERK